MNHRFLRQRRTGFTSAVLLGGIVIVRVFAVGAGEKELPIDASNMPSHMLLSGQLEYCEDENASLSADGIASGKYDSLFRKNRFRVLHFPWSKSAFWIRFNIKNDRRAPIEKWIVISYHFIDTIEAYVNDGGEMKLLQKTGRHFAFNSRAGRYRSYCIPVHIDAEKTATVYHRIRSSEAVSMPITLWAPEAFRAHYDKHTFFYGIFYGIIGLILFINIALFFFSKERCYLYYAFMLLFLHILFTMGRQGISQMFLFPSFPKIESLAHLSFAALGETFALLLSRSFLQYRFKHTVWRNLFYSLIATLLIMGALPFIAGYWPTTQLLSMISIASIATIVSISVIKVVRGNRPAIYFLIAWVFHILGAATIILDQWGMLQSSLLITHGYQLGIVIEAVLISSAMAYAVVLERKEKTKAVNEFLHSQEVALQHMAESVRARIQELQAKVSPHFLFNALNSIAQLVKDDTDKAENAVVMLADFYRILLNFSQRKLVKLNEKIHLVDLYMALQRIRFGDRISFSKNIERDIAEYQIPALIIQPLVENCIKHGISPKVEGGRISVEATSAQGEVRITVADDGVGWSEKASDSGHGLCNIRERLKLIFGDRYTMTITSPPDTGVCVEILLPKEVHDGIQSDHHR
ncbi:MAG: histidine kinase [Chitinispirillaceae bacterium]|nr:histidine kinase [Chitinispirillaceae bacterium]